ncbi:exosome RNA helicase MTR4 isoform X2 [Teleopsis dalmanni]|uniref:exosome RNA helicase MTR4 isoform X2 n=1 Tax=Teleopsis dalmanni TaxID=139649 RepID=UPI0018CDCA02|nr:exosome RNA helicase MTR4 isoform X2 [Teleopsis dalmanni]
MDGIDDLFGAFDEQEEEQPSVLKRVREQIRSAKHQSQEPVDNDVPSAKIPRSAVEMRKSLDKSDASNEAGPKVQHTNDKRSTKEKQESREVKTTKQQVDKQRPSEKSIDGLSPQNDKIKKKRDRTREKRAGSTKLTDISRNRNYNYKNENESVTSNVKEHKDKKAVREADNTVKAARGFIETATKSSLECKSSDKIKNDKNIGNNDLSESKQDFEETEIMLAGLPKDIFLNNINIRVLKAPDSCTHEVAVLTDQPYIELEESTTTPAKEYSFVLDAFQQRAILCIENGQSVLVSAHTSAGKTVVAEYAIAKSLLMKQRVIYTTPIKALSNQKFREFTLEFGDVGIITGDVTINPSASCLIMTTEILRNMLYRGSEVMREVGWVIFDEIHYMRDKERGVVWEESLILLPDNVHFVFLSATIPNARQFAEWVTHLHKQPCHVVYTDYRPTPLQHYIFPAGGDGIYQIVDEKGVFREENFNTAMAVMQKGKGPKSNKLGRKGGMRGVNGEQSNIFKILKMVMENKFAPVIIFSFSKRECEAYAMQLAKLDFNIAAEKKLIMEVFNNATSVLNESDRNLPQINNILPLLLRGIGIHHGGLLPLLKEIVEILFGEGLLKALFATETFAMGLNMPARTVVFSAPRKFDGQNFRWISSGEYIQMAGRAGRRGIDDKGIVILMIDEEVSPATGRSIVKGEADAIISEFHLSYNMVLNLLRVEEVNPEYMLERSFRQFQNQTNIPNLFNKYKDKQKELAKMKIPNEGNVITYHNIRTKLENLKTKYISWLTKPQYLKPFMHRGRLLQIKNAKYEYDWGVVVNLIEEKKRNPTDTSDEKLHFQILLHVTEGTEKDEFPKPFQQGEKGNMEVVNVSSDDILSISSLRVYVPDELRQSDHRLSVVMTMREIKKRFPKGIPKLNPKKDLKIKSSEFDEIVELIEVYEDRLYKHSLHTTETDADVYPLYLKKQHIQDELQALRDKIKDARSLLQMDELNYRKRVLRRLEYATSSDVIEFKGRVACELSAADELLLTELMFNGVFNDLTSFQIAAMLSCFVCDEKSSETPKLTMELAEPLRIMQDLARRIAKISRECKLPLDEDEYLEKFKPTLMDVIYNWCKGAAFASICKQTDVFEGSIIRCMRRLEELLRQMNQAAKTIGNTELENKFSDGVKLLKRDIVFAASLYL